MFSKMFIYSFKGYTCLRIIFGIPHSTTTISTIKKINISLNTESDDFELVV